MGVLPDGRIVKCHDVAVRAKSCITVYMRTLSAVAAHNATEREVKTTRLAELPWSRHVCCTTRVSYLVCQYRVKVKTSNNNNAATRAAVRIKIHHSFSNTGLNTGWKQLNPPGRHLRRGSTNYFTIWGTCLYYFAAIRLRHNNAGPAPYWRVQYVGVKRVAPNSRYQIFYCNSWLATWTSLNRRFTSSRTPFKIKVHTGNQSNAGTQAVVKIRFKASTWSPFMTLPGSFGAGSWRTFYRRMYNTQTVFKMIAQHNNAGPGPSWYLDRISVFNRAAMKYSRCAFRRWISWGNLSRKVLCRFVPPNLA
ncbi:hypothetical protein NP493_2670g00005 [Ridgeia piscesae]|uniref:PLAT domain-containing protein n=1 Tax=Ridgeia piscesae TaxID=27915 RepID=A0AAD9JDI2_RIDPI|nr:hypothetical protein NP493_2670g00005 [Ridgeia piscesae]